LLKKKEGEIKKEKIKDRSCHGGCWKNRGRKPKPVSRYVPVRL